MELARGRISVTSPARPRRPNDDRPQVVSARRDARSVGTAKGPLPSMINCIECLQKPGFSPSETRFLANQLSRIVRFGSTDFPAASVRPGRGGSKWYDRHMYLLERSAS